MIVKVLGAIDIIAAIAFLMLVFELPPFKQFLLFCIALLTLKGLFIFTGEIVLSTIDLFSALALFLSLFFTLSPILLWIPAFLLLAKGFVSFT